MKRYRHTAIIGCPSGFSVDMLRYDQCYPRTERDAGKIERVKARHGGEITDDDRRIEVEKINNEKKADWTPDRWRSFNMQVLEMRTEALNS